MDLSVLYFTFAYFSLFPRIVGVTLIYLNFNLSDQKSSPALKGPPLLPGNHGNSEANIEAQIRQLQAGSLGEKFISG